MGSGHLRVFLHDYGGYVFTAQLARALALRGHQVLYLFSVTNQLVQRFSPHSELDHLTIVGVSLPGRFLRYNYLQRWKGEHAHGRKVARRVRTFRPDVVLSANSPLDTQKLIQSASHEVGAKFIFWMQDAIGLATKNALSSNIPLIGNFIGDHYLRMERSLIKASDKVMIGMVVASLVVGSSLVLQASPFELPREIGWIAILGYTAAVLVGFYAIYHVIFLKFRMVR